MITPWLSTLSTKLLFRMLEVDPQKRMTTDELRKCEWMKLDTKLPVEIKIQVCGSNASARGHDGIFANSC